MLDTRQFLAEKARRLLHPRFTLLLVAFSVGVACLIAAGIASAAEAISEVQTKRVPVAQVFTFLFLMLGPFKIIGPFSRITKGADAALTRQIALRAIAYSSLALLIAAFLGESFLKNYGIPVPVLGLSGGIILFLVALQNILQQFATPESHSEENSGPPPPPTLRVALTPLAFPTIVTPYGIAALVVFLALSKDVEAQLTIGAIALGIMLLNLVVMLLTPRILPILGLVLAILGAVLGIIQVALGLLIINNSLKAMGAL